MAQKKLISLEEFKNKETFVRLYERVFDIECKIQQLENISKLNIDLINALERSGIDFMNMIFVYTEYVFVLYRSMFQASDWEEETPRCYILPSAYEYPNQFIEMHDEIIDHVDKVLAHQDINARQRHLYAPIKNEKDGESYLFCRRIKYHAHMLLPHTTLMKDTIKKIYRSKFNEELKLFLEVHRYKNNLTHPEMVTN